jgi:sec-independent protein translocase protein TatC
VPTTRHALSGGGAVAIIERAPSFHPSPPLAVPRDQHEDLFESTKMTFGEHLEELRRSLFKALAALLIGTLIGLLFAQDLVDYVQTPLRQALSEYYQDLAEKEYLKELETQRDLGADVPDDLEAAARRYADQGLVPKRYRLDWRELMGELERVAPDLLDFDTIATPPTTLPDADDLIPITLYQSIEDDARISTIALSMQEPFIIFMKAALLLGVVLSSPFIFYFIWSFVAAGLFPHERRYVHVFLPFSIGLFLVGALLAFFVVFQFVLSFLLSFYIWMGIAPYPRITDWLNLVLVLPLGFGIGFQLPLVMLFLERIGIFTVTIYQEKWRISVLIISILSMLLTPADYQSMLFMFVSLTLLYFGGILLCKFLPRKSAPFGDMAE